MVRKYRTTEEWHIDYIHSNANVPILVTGYAVLEPKWLTGSICAVPEHMIDEHLEKYPHTVAVFYPFNIGFRKWVVFESTQSHLMDNKPEIEPYEV